MKFSAIVAVGQNSEIGQGGHMPWPHIRRDMQHFVSLTDGKVVIMGRKTWDSFQVRPLSNRANIVLTSSPDSIVRCPDAETGKTIVRAVSSVREASLYARSCVKQLGYPDEVMVIGGARVYDACWSLIETCYVTTVDGHFPQADTLFRHYPFDHCWELTSEVYHMNTKPHTIGFRTYTRILPEYDHGR